MTTAKRGGRRPLDAHDVSVHVSVSLPSKQVDELRERAQRERVSVPEMIRRDLREGRDAEKERR